MTELTINIPDKKLPFFMLLAKELDFVVVDEKKTTKKQAAKPKRAAVKTEKEAILANIKTGLEEVRLFKKGKLKTTSAKDFLNEL